MKALIGRAVRLVLNNIGGATPGVLDRSTQGSPAKYAFCFAENEADLRILNSRAAITMSFAAFTSAMIVRQGTAPLVHITLPPVLYLNTLLIIASSVTLELSRRQIAAFMGGVHDRDHSAIPSRWLYVTLFLGLLFVAGQTFAWIQLKSQGFGLATNISYSFFYVLTVAHALHVFGGLGGLIRVIGKVHHSVLRRSTLDATSRYWHFMGALWVYLLLLLWIKL